MERRKLMRRLFQSQEMADYLSVYELSEEKLIETIGGAPISLEEKLDMLQSLTKWEGDPFAASACEVKKAIQSLTTKSGEFFYVKNCWPDYEEGWPDIAPMEPYPDLKSAMHGIRLFLEEEKCDRGSCYWFILEKWILHESGKYVCPYSYTVANHEILYFNRGNKMFSQGGIFSESTDLNLPIPFHPGDIVQLDCMPFAFRANAVLIEVGDNRDCCSVQAMFQNESGKWSVGALKHSHVFPKDYRPPLSPLYRLSPVHQKLDEEERILEEVSAFIAGSDERGAEFYEEVALKHHPDAFESEIRRIIKGQRK